MRAVSSVSAGVSVFIVAVGAMIAGEKPHERVRVFREVAFCEEVRVKATGTVFIKQNANCRHGSQSSPGSIPKLSACITSLRQLSVSQ